METNPFIGDVLVALHKELKTLTERGLRPLGIGMGQLQILMLLYSSPGKAHTQQEISRALGVDKGNISRSIAKLLERDWIEPLPEDPRRLRLTDAGQARRDAVQACLASLEQRMTRGLDSGELAGAVQVLHRLLKNLEE